MEEGSWASGRWEVKEGKAEEFVQRWRDWLTRTSQDVPGFRSARLLRAINDPQMFTSLSEWDDTASRDAWKASPDFMSGLESAKALCDEFVGGDQDVATVITGHTMVGS